MSTRTLDDCVSALAQDESKCCFVCRRDLSILIEKRICADYDGDDYEKTRCLLIYDRYITRITNSTSHDFNALEIRLIIIYRYIITYIIINDEVCIVCGRYRVYGYAWGPKAIVFGCEHSIIKNYGMVSVSGQMCMRCYNVNLVDFIVSYRV